MNYYYLQFVSVLFASELLWTDALFIIPSYSLRGVTPVFMGMEENGVNGNENIDYYDYNFINDFVSDFNDFNDFNNINNFNDSNSDKDKDNNTSKYDLRGSHDFVEKQTCLQTYWDKNTTAFYCAILLLAGILTHAI